VVDQHGFVVDILVQSRRDQHAAEAFIRRTVEGWDYTPRVVITDKLASYPPAIRRVLPNTEHRRHKGLNNRAENSHLPTRPRERRMQRFKSSEQAQRFLEPFSTVCNHFRPRRHRLTATGLPPAYGGEAADLAPSHRGSVCPLTRCHYLPRPVLGSPGAH
jgi:putative transposase